MAITLIGSNLNTYGDSGTFESVPSGWGANFNAIPDINQTVTNSTSYANEGTASCILVVSAIGGTKPTARLGIRNIAAASVTAGHKYVCFARVYTPSGDLLGDNNLYIYLAKAGGTQLLGATVAQCTDTWIEIQIFFTAGATGTEYWDLVIDRSTGAPTYLGELYIDNIRVYEYLDDVTPISATFAVVDSKGPSSGDGSITVTASGGVPAYEYSKKFGETYQAGNVFSSLFPGGYSMVVRDSVLAVYTQNIVVGVRGRWFSFYYVLTNETTLGAADGIIAIYITDKPGFTQDGSPYEYSKDGGATYSYVNQFTGLSPGLYVVMVRDVYGNTMTKKATIKAGVIVCSLDFSPEVKIVNASGYGFNDGSIELVASDDISGGIPKYSITGDFTYASGGSTSGLFETLVEGDYTVIARTSDSCKAETTVHVGVDEVLYGERFYYLFDGLRLDLYQAAQGESSYGSNNQFKFVIDQLDYSGSSDMIQNGTESPIRLSWRDEGSENPFSSQVVSSELGFSFISETAQQYIELYDAAENKFRGSLYLFNGNTATYSLIWQGFAIPMLWSEPYVTDTKYPVSITFTDQLASLKDVTFSDFGENFPKTRISILQSVCFCLFKTNLTLDILDSANILANGMVSLPTDGYLNQTYIDPIIHTDKSCADVLSALLVGCRLYQSGGKWRIEVRSEKTASVEEYRVYNYLGEYQSFGYNEPRIALKGASFSSPKVSFSDQSAMMKICETFGTINFNYELGLEEDNNLLLTGKFDVIDLTGGQLKGWQLTGYGTYDLLVYSPGRPGDTALKISFNPFGVNEQPVTLSSVGRSMNGTDGVNYKLKLSFDLFSIPTISNIYTYFDFRLFIYDSVAGENKYLQHEIGINTGVNYFSSDTTHLLDDGFIRVYIDEHMAWKAFTYETLVDVETYGHDIEGNLSVEIKFYPNNLWDCDTTADLKAVDTTIYTTQQFDNRRILVDSAGSPTSLFIYKLQYNSDSESLPDVVRPTTHVGYNWILDKAIPVPDSSATGFLQAMLLDNVKVEYLPDGTEPETEIPLTVIINKNIKPVYNQTLYHGDIIYDEIEGGDLDPNYENIMRAHFTKADGTAIYGGWTRRGLGEKKYFHNLLADMYKGLFSSKRWKLTGELNSFDLLLGFHNTLWEYRTGKVYTFASLDLDLRNMRASIEVLEQIIGTPAVGDDDPLPVEPGVFREHSSEFSLEFS